mmetsp:Transcript_8370/g.16670  ORF Transcript_8370/g.16670 Transcript_8370/m.16670 type:complete len:843 (+) Transcript_8370:493-3021(+)
MDSHQLNFGDDDGMLYFGSMPGDDLMNRKSANIASTGEQSASMLYSFHAPAGDSQYYSSDHNVELPLTPSGTLYGGASEGQATSSPPSNGNEDDHSKSIYLTHRGSSSSLSSSGSLPHSPTQQPSQEPQLYKRKPTNAGASSNCDGCWIPSWSIEPLSTFEAGYERRWDGRNKTKNLRCFPAHGKNGCAGEHQQRGYCGSAADFKATLNQGFQSYGPLCAYALLCPVSGQDLQSQFASHEGVMENDLANITGMISCEIISGTNSRTSSNLQSVIVRVRGDRMKWNYMWQSSRQLKHVEHCLNVFLFEKYDDGFLRLVSTKASPPFTLTSGRTILRRKRDRLEEESAHRNITNSDPDLENRTRMKKSSRAKLIAGLMALCHAEKIRCGQLQKNRAYIRRQELVSNIAAPLFLETLGDEDLSSFLFGDSDELELDMDDANFDFDDPLDAALDTSNLEPINNPVHPGAAQHAAVAVGIPPQVASSGYASVPVAKTEDKTTNSPFKDEFRERQNYMLREIAENRKMGETLDRFFESCTTGPAGESLEAALSTSQSGLLENDFARAIALRLYESFEQSLGSVIEEILADQADELQEFQDSDVKTLESFLMCIPAANKKRDLIRQFKLVNPDSRYDHINGSWRRIEGDAAAYDDFLVEEMGIMTRSFASQISQSMSHFEVRIANNTFHNLMGDPTGPWTQMLVKNFQYTEEPVTFSASGVLFWIGRFPDKKGKCRQLFSPDGRYATHQAIYLMTSDYTKAMYGDTPGTATMEGGEDPPLTYVMVIDSLTSELANPNILINEKRAYEFAQEPSLSFGNIDAIIESEPALCHSIMKYERAGPPGRPENFF